MRGTAFVVFEIWLWLTVALLIGIVIGWIIRGWRRDDHRESTASGRATPVDDSANDRAEGDQADGPDEPSDDPS